MSKTAKIGVFIGRMQPMHLGHLEAIQQVMEASDGIVIGIGSSNKARSTKNPFLFEERQKIINEVIGNNNPDQKPFMTVGIPDFTYNNQLWYENTAGLVEEAAESVARSIPLPREHFDLDKHEPYSAEITLFGFDQGPDTFYLHCFPQWGDPCLTNRTHKFHATDVRRSLLFERTPNWAAMVPSECMTFVSNFSKESSAFIDLIAEAEMVTKIKAEKAAYPHPIIDHTVDAVMISQGHVLMVTRGRNPGKGQLALPGGYLNEFESMKNGIARELWEETRIFENKDAKDMGRWEAIPRLRRMLHHDRIKEFSAPDRSVRGRIITHCGLINYHTHKLPVVRGSDDASSAQWIPLNKLDELATNIFEDHYCIIRNMLGHC